MGSLLNCKTATDYLAILLELTLEGVNIVERQRALLIYLVQV